MEAQCGQANGFLQAAGVGTTLPEQLAHCHTAVWILTLPLRWVLTEYVEYFNQARPHQGIK